MKLSFITPTKWISSYGAQGQFTMGLAHLIELDKETQYEKEIKKCPLPIVLDNGCFEKGYPEGIDSLIQKAIKVNAECVFMPDFLYDSPRTKEAIENFFYIKNKIYSNAKFKCGAIIQAKSKDQYIKDYLQFNNDPRIDVIGLSYLAIKESMSKYKPTRTFSITEARREMMKLMFAEEKPKKRIHLLGIGESYNDVLDCKNLDVEVYNDSSICFQAGLKRHEFESPTLKEGKPKDKVDFDLDSLPTEANIIIARNINFIKKYAD